METIFAALACCLLVVPFAVAQREEEKPTATTPSPDLNTTDATATTPSSSGSTGHATAASNSTENTTPFTATSWDNGTSAGTTAAATSESTTRLQTSQSATNGTNGTSPTTTTTPGTPTSPAPTATQTTVGYVSTADTTAITTASSSHTVNKTSASTDRTTQGGLGLNVSEKNMTIVFSVVLGVFALAVVVFMFHKCKHRIQYLHQPLNNTGDTADEFVADDDTLVISGGLYDGHPIYDNVPTVSEDQSQFRLQFLH